MSRPILVTGGTGFIGSRLCEMLSLDYRISYRALVRNLSKAARIARLDCDLALGDLSDVESLYKALDGCVAVVNLAHGDDKTAAKEARNLVTACRRAGVKTIVHVSSMAVHGPSPGLAAMNEANAPMRRWGEAYSDAKAASEAVIRGASGLNTVTVRPTIVYGPYSFFVTPIIADAHAGRVSLIDGGRGICNAVYVDDVCDAIVAGLARAGAEHPAYLINGDDRLTWRQFIEAFANLVDVPKTELNVDRVAVEAHWQKRGSWLGTSVKAALRLAASPEFHAQLATIPALGSALRTSKDMLSRIITSEQRTRLKLCAQGPRRIDPYIPLVADAAPPTKVPSLGRLVREGYQTFIENDLAKRDLGWTPRHSFVQGLAKTKLWLGFARLL